MEAIREVVNDMKIEDRFPEDGYTIDVCITRDSARKYRVRDGLTHLGFIYDMGGGLFAWEVASGVKGQEIYHRGQVSNFGLAVGEILSGHFEPGRT
jgi:hypothetical protein